MAKKEIVESESNGREKRKYMLSILILIFPSLLIAMTSAIENRLLQLFFQILLLIFQGILVKNFVGEYFGELN